MSVEFAQPVSLGHNVFMIDLMEQNQPFRTAAYLIKDEQLTLIETGSANSHDTLLRGLAALGVRPEDLAYIIVTHVHLDHAGGAGQMMEKASNAQLVVHPRGARHMIDPSRLWEGAKQVYQERITELFGSMVPIPAERVLIRAHQETLNIGSRTLTFFDSPGHAKHHFTILDPVSNALFAGDAVGVRYRTGMTHWDFEFIMPSSSPVDFDPIAVDKTLNFLKEQPFQWVYHAHFGKSPKDEAIFQTGRIADAFAALIRDMYRSDITVDEVIQGLRGWVSDDLRNQGFTVGSMEVLDIDIVLDAMGLIYYEAHRRQNEAALSY